MRPPRATAEMRSFRQPTALRDEKSGAFCPTSENRSCGRRQNDAALLVAEFSGGMSVIIKSFLAASALIVGLASTSGFAAEGSIPDSGPAAAPPAAATPASGHDRPDKDRDHHKKPHDKEPRHHERLPHPHAKLHHPHVKVHAPHLKPHHPPDRIHTPHVKFHNPHAKPVHPNARPHVPHPGPGHLPAEEGVRPGATTSASGAPAHAPAKAIGTTGHCRHYIDHGVKKTRCPAPAKP